MQIQVHFSDIENSWAINNHVQQRIAQAIKTGLKQITRIDVHLHDDSGPCKSGTSDKRCTIEMRLAGMDPMSIEQHGNDMYAVINQATRKLQQSLIKTRSRQRDHRAQMRHVAMMN
ncbi:MAG TPA: ribosome-associated translation inhibitor RaiA [Phycisphaerales bacterium]|nr:ribosome-associated translation inhibitor RaiA [Phycisphaerales bacterium]HCD34321.1 ribosome-associated translation inhibitor RaiA [Phycisphaerales bacterium]|tara:strand:- start:1247 stop:1594 length:348 start_codon:yes stop_codon:yes gene_type:complete